MTETTGFYIGDVNGQCTFSYADEPSGEERKALWRCPMDRLHEFGVGGMPTKVRLVLDGERVVSVEVIPYP